ncbi:MULTISPECIES: sensor domain-containing diguanylate cyclase [Nocardia]|uniref:sensor domain-containing diguanylate cyclase n=1 Tax=Nocardia TaxID=1817 RepID=UPI0013003FC9|nr:MULTISPECIES: sensor domain-containing diguanylate cyclase [Nocardia]
MPDIGRPEFGRAGGLAVMDRHEIAEMAALWCEAVLDAGFAVRSRRDVRAAMATWLADLDAAMDAEPFDPAPGRRIGREMARADLHGSAVVRASATAWAGLLEHSRRPDRAQRFGAVMADLGCGLSTGSPSAVAREQEIAAERFRAVFDNAAIAIALYDVNGLTIDANRATARMVGIPGDELPGTAGLRLVHPDDRDRLRDLVIDLRRRGSGTLRFEGRFRRGDGTVGWGTWTMTLMHGEDDDAYLLAVGEDNTERHTMQAELRWLAEHDPLTGLPNRRCLVDQLERIAAEADPTDLVGLCLVDLDGFKLVNDRHGHAAGDRLLTEIGRRLSDALCSPSVALARIGGDEFVALLEPPCDDNRVGAAAATILAALREPMPIGATRPLSITASIGAVVVPVAGADPEKLLHAADVGLYRAKAGGRGTWVLQP